jgi:hypothetical protein
MGCQNFATNLLQVSGDGEWVDGGIKSCRCWDHSLLFQKPNGFSCSIEQEYLDAVHMDIAFGNCLLVGGF